MVETQLYMSLSVSAAMFVSTNEVHNYGAPVLIKEIYFGYQTSCRFKEKLTAKNTI